MATTQATHKVESVFEQLSKREVRALIEPMAVLDDVGVVAGAKDLYEVTSTSSYIVDMDESDGPRCTCKDHQFRGVDCAHIERVRFATGRKAIPGWVNGAQIDDQLGKHVTTGEPRIAMPDGGIRSAAPTEADGHHATDLERVDGGWLVWAVEGDARRLAAFADVDDWDAIRSEVARRGLDVGTIHHLDEVSLEEVA